MSVVTFTTDWGNRDYHIGALKGMLISKLPDIRFIDLSHQVARHHIQQAAYIFGNAYHCFPPGTLHFIGVHGNSNYYPELLAIKKGGHIFIGVNDGFFSLIFQDAPVDMVRLKSETENAELFDLNLIADSIFQLLSGKNIYELGDRPSHYVQRSAFLPAIDDELIHGIVIYIDDFGNVVTNISKSLFIEQRKGRKFEVVTRKNQHTIDVISSSYHAVDPGSALALFNDAGNLEIAINEENASKLMNLKLNDNIRIEFK